LMSAAETALPIPDPAPVTMAIMALLYRYQWGQRRGRLAGRHSLPA
jgi:hypothetical protein